MSSFQKALEALQPYVIGIRYIDGLPVLDVVFKDGWTVPDSNLITKTKGNNELNYYMIFSDKDGIGLDELLEYVDATIKINIEREKKHELLKERVLELKELFKKNSLLKLKRLNFSFNDEELVPELDEFEIDEIYETPNEEKVEVIDKEPLIQNPPATQQNTNEEYLMTNEDREMMEEEFRAESFKKMQDSKKLNGQMNKLKRKVELPPRKEIQETDTLEPDCDCGPNEACNKCIGTKDL